MKNKLFIQIITFNFGLNSSEFKIKPTKFDFEPKGHIDLMIQNDMADFERGTKVAGFRGYFLKNAGARLEFAVWQAAMDFFTKRGLS